MHGCIQGKDYLAASLEMNGMLATLLFIYIYRSNDGILWQ
jgi:hypothetical protein